MNLRHLEHWIALAELGSFSRAADKLHMTQSALSRSIQALEEDLGGALIDRIGKRNELTPLGHTVLARARRIVDEAAELKQTAAVLQAGGAGKLHVGLGSGAGALLMTPWLVYMGQNFPKIQVAVTRGPPDLQLQQLRERRLDILVVDVRRVVPAADLVIGPVYEVATGWVARAGHPLLAQYPGAIPFEAILDYPIASTPLSDEVARRLVARYGDRADPAQFTTLQCEEITSLIETLGQTNAIYLGVLGPAQAGLARGDWVVLPISPTLNTGAQLGVVTLAGRSGSPMMDVFQQFVARELATS